MRILVTGGGGIIGRHIQEKINLHFKNAEIILFKGDLANTNQSQDFITSVGPINNVIHLAAMVSVDAVQADPAKAYSINVGGTVNLLSALAKNGFAPHFFHCSSAHVYAPKPSAISETSTTAPISLYGRTKLMAEIVARDICEKYRIPLCIGRLFSIHDPLQIGPYLRPSIMKRLLNEDLNLPFNLYGANSIRDFLTAEQASELIVMISVAKYCGTINIGSGEPTRIRDFVQGFVSEKLDIRHKGNQDCLLADTTRLNAFLEEKNV